MDRSPGGAGDLELPPGRELRPGIVMYPTAWSESWDRRLEQPDDPRYRLIALASWAVWLVFLAYPIGDLLGGRLHGVRAVLAATGLAVFVALYVALMWPLARRAEPSAAGERRRLVLLGVFAAVAIGLAYGFGKSWVGAFIYLGVACGATLPPRRAVPALVVASGLAFGAAWAAHAGAPDMAFYPFVTLIIGLVVLGWIRAMGFIHELREAREEVARLAVNGERLRFARDLHDLLGHSLSLIVLKSELARRLLDRDPEAALREVQEIELVARQSLVEVRQAVSGYRSQGLRDEMDDAAAALSAAGIDPVVRDTGGLLPPPSERVLGRVVREGVTNVVRHSGAGRCEIEVRRLDGAVVVEIRDDGQGPLPGSGTGSGLPGLAERMAMAGGTLEAGPARGGGFHLTARIPIEDPEPAPPPGGAAVDVPGPV